MSRNLRRLSFLLLCCGCTPGGSPDPHTALLLRERDSLLEAVRYERPENDFLFVQEHYGHVYGLWRDKKLQLPLRDSTSGILEQLPFSPDLFHREGLRGKYNVDSSAFTKAEEEVCVPSVRNSPVRSGETDYFR